MKRYIAIVVGNSTTKLVRIDGNELKERLRFPSNGSNTNRVNAAHWMKKSSSECCGISVNHKSSAKLEEAMLEAEIDWTEFRATDFPFASEYKTPETLGSDRAAAIFGALKHYAEPSAPLLVIDLGTAFTFNVIDEHGTFLGGAIAPGIAAMMSALSHSTAELHSQKAKFPPALVGQTTEEAMQSGVMFASVNIVVGMITDIRRDYGSEVKIIYTGGSYHTISEQLAERIGEHTYDEDLVIKGIAALCEQRAPKTE